MPDFAEISRKILSNVQQN